MDLLEYNQDAWDRLVGKGDRWTIPVSPDAVSAARNGDWDVVLTPQKPVPRNWFPKLDGCSVLCLASGGGQQTPILAATGARVTVLDNSPKQLDQDQLVADREGLTIVTEHGDMRDLSRFSNDSFDVVFNPCSVSFVPNVDAVFRETHRVLKRGGRLMCGFVNPVRYIFDEAKLATGELHVRHKLPYADEARLTSEEFQQLLAKHEPVVFSHSLEQIIAGQLKVGYVLRDFYEDVSDDDRVSEFIPTTFATLAVKPAN